MKVVYASFKKKNSAALKPKEIANLLPCKIIRKKVKFEIQPGKLLESKK